MIMKLMILVRITKAVMLKTLSDDGNYLNACMHNDGDYEWIHDNAQRRLRLMRVDHEKVLGRELIFLLSLYMFQS